MFDEINVTGVAFLEGVKVHDVELADLDWIKRASVIGSRRILVFFEDILPSSCEYAHAWTLVPAFFLHPFHACWVAFNNEMFCRLGILEVCVDLNVHSFNMGYVI